MTQQVNIMSANHLMSQLQQGLQQIIPGSLQQAIPGIMTGPNCQGRSTGMEFDVIQHLDFKCTKEELEEMCEDIDSGSDWWATSELKTKQGKVILALEDKTAKVSSGDGIPNSANKDCAYVMIQYDPVSKICEFKAFKMASKNFYSGGSEKIHYTLHRLALNQQGDYVGCVKGASPTIVIGGNSKSAEIAIIERGSKVEFSSTVLDIDDSGNGTPLPQLKVQMSIREFLQKHQDIKTEMMAYPTAPDNLNFLVKRVMQMKLNDELDFQTFVDIFRQCVLFGANDPLVTKFSKLLSL